MNIVVNDVSYYVDMWGEGEPLVVLHGFTGNARSWRRFQPYWQHHSKVIAIDIIGHGQTDCPNDVEKYKIETMATVISHILNTLQIEKANILGYSMGGRLALTFAILYKERVQTLILESASPGLEKEEERQQRREQDKKLSERIARNGVQSFVDYWENIPLFASQKRLNASIQKEVREERLANNEVGLINSLLGMGTGFQPSWWDELHHIDACLVTGSLDEKFCHIAAKMEKRLRSTEWINVEGVGHAIHVENPHLFGTIISKLLKRYNT